MKRNGSYLRQYLPWLGLLLGVDALAALLLWLTDARAFAAMAAVIVLATVFLFAGVCAVLCARSKRREQAFTAFLTTPDAAHEQALCRLLSPAESQSAHLLGETLRAQQQTIAQLQTQMDDYENYVEIWAHEVKTPLALLTLVLDNRRDTLPEAVGFKLDYVRNRMQAFIDQMLFYARLRGARRDYRFERLTLRSCIDEVLDDYRPLLEEKHFRVELQLADETVFSDRRGLCFLLGQVVSNSVKYALDAPVLTFPWKTAARRPSCPSATTARACARATCRMCLKKASPETPATRRTRPPAWGSTSRARSRRIWGSRSPPHPAGARGSRSGSRSRS